jgi:hypothetical protein
VDGLGKHRCGPAEAPLPETVGGHRVGRDPAPWSSAEVKVGPIAVAAPRTVK